jgi:hypothetical protein
VRGFIHDFTLPRRYCGGFSGSIENVFLDFLHNYGTNSPSNTPTGYTETDTLLQKLYATGSYTVTRSGTDPSGEIADYQIVIETDKAIMDDFSTSVASGSLQYGTEMRDAVALESTITLTQYDGLQGELGLIQYYPIWEESTPGKWFRDKDVSEKGTILLYAWKQEFSTSDLSYEGNTLGFTISVSDGEGNSNNDQTRTVEISDMTVNGQQVDLSEWSGLDDWKQWMSDLANGKITSL